MLSQLGLRNGFPSACSIHTGDWYLLRGLKKLLCYCCGKDGLIASWAELQGEGQSSYQLDSQVCDRHLLIQDCHSLLSQDGIRKRRQDLIRKISVSTRCFCTGPLHRGSYFKANKQ